MVETGPAPSSASDPVSCAAFPAAPCPRRRRQRRSPRPRSAPPTATTAARRPPAAGTAATRHARTSRAGASEGDVGVAGEEREEERGDGSRWKPTSAALSAAHGSGTARGAKQRCG